MTNSATDNTTENQNYLVLARKYRPQTFDQLIGQGALVQTLSNAIKANRLHHAYILHGIRGTGKTTTARILAKVLNCENGPAVTWDADDTQCQAIANGNHVDVLEFDAASHTGVDDIRELFEGVHYAPAQGKYKVYIIDEVHMLSKQAFNALLKTLEEPPEHVKFIFATTEVNKIPVTVLSRCQRFDLKRVGADELTAYFMKLLTEEKVPAQEAAVHMIARAADGSVRDGLSLLDQAIALSAGQEVTEVIVGEMLGMADKTQLFDLFDSIMAGDAEQGLEKFNKMYEGGQDPLLIIADLLQLSHLITKLKVVKTFKNSADLTELEKTKGVEFAEKLNLENLARVYQMLLTAAEESKRADRPFETVEMALIRIMHLAPIASVAGLIAGGISNTATVKKPPSGRGFRKEDSKPLIDSVAGELSNSEVGSEQINSWRELAKVVRTAEPTLGHILEQQVRPVAFAVGELTVNILPGLHTADEIIRNLAKLLHKLTSQSWKIMQDSSGETETLAETYEREGNERIAKANEHPDVKKILDTFPDAEVVKVEIKN